MKKILQSALALGALLCAGSAWAGELSYGLDLKPTYVSRAVRGAVSGEKEQGFMVGVAGRVGYAVSPLINLGLQTEAYYGGLDTEGRTRKVTVNKEYYAFKGEATVGPHLESGAEAFSGMFTLDPYLGAGGIMLTHNGSRSSASYMGDFAQAYVVGGGTLGYRFEKGANLGADSVFAGVKLKRQIYAKSRSNVAEDGVVVFEKPDSNRYGFGASAGMVTGRYRLALEYETFNLGESRDMASQDNHTLSAVLGVSF